MRIELRVEMTRWMDRSFPADLDPGLLPGIVERLSGAPGRIAGKLAAAPASLLAVRDPGWSLLDHAGHLLDLEELHLGRLDDLAAAAEVLRAADLSNRRTTEAGHGRRAPAELAAAFDAERSRFIARLAGLDAAALRRRSRHPRLQQPMTAVDLAYFVAEHDDHHLARMTQLARRLGG